MSLFRTRYDRPQRLRKAEVSASGMWSKSILSFPVVDLAGDYVVPEGLDFSSHQLDPHVDLEHARDPHVGGMPVAWARESLAEPGAPYAVEWVRMNVSGEGEPPEYHRLPVGTSYFDKSCRVSSQVFALVEQDVLPAVSIEFRPVPGYFKALGRSPLEPRNAYRFDKADVVRWTICQKGVNPGALSLAKSLPATATQVPSALGKILTDRRVNVGGRYEPLCPVLLKALSPAAPNTTRTTVRVEKSMNDEYDDDDAMDTGAMDAGADLDTEAAVEEEAPAEEPPASNGVTALLAASQAVIDACEQLKQALGNTDSADIYKDGMKHCDMLESFAEKLKATADKHDAKLAAIKGGSEPEEPEEGAEETEDAPDMETDEDGVFKAVRPVYRELLKPIVKALKARRFSLAEVQKAAAESRPAEDTAALERKLARLERNLKHI